MRRFFKWSLGYAIAGILAGVASRELSVFLNHPERSSLGLSHAHLLALGAGAFLIIALLQDRVGLTESSLFRPFMYCYNIGLMTTAAMLGVRGYWEMTGLPNTPAISGIAGAGHILLGTGIILLLAALLQRTRPAAHGSGSSEGSGSGF